MKAFAYDNISIVAQPTEFVHHNIKRCITENLVMPQKKVS